MLQRNENLLKMGSTLSESHFNTMIMSSLPESYRPTLQTITAAEKTNSLLGKTSKCMSADDLIAFFIEEAQHRVINDDRNKLAESALAAHGRQCSKAKGKLSAKQSKPELDITCDNCKKAGHTKADCWSKGGGKEGQGPRQKKAKKNKSAVVANEDDNDLFAFTCTSDYVAVAKALQVLKSKLGGCVDSGASRDYSPDRTRFTNYWEINHDITTADGHTIKAFRMGDLHMELPNGSKRTDFTFKNAIHAPDMAFTLVSIR